MKILALTDIHGSYERMVEIIAANPSVDVVVIGGDWTTFGTAPEIRAAVGQASSSGKPVLAVCGNMDPVPLEGEIESLGVSINGRGVVVQDVGFFGVSSAPISPLHTPNEISEEEILERAESGWKHVTTSKWKVFVPHAPPLNTALDRIRSGKHVGSTSVRTFIELHQPDLTICGHIHEARGTDLIVKTKIVNCGPASLGYYALIGLGQEVTIGLRP